MGRHSREGGNPAQAEYFGCRRKAKAERHWAFCFSVGLTDKVFLDEL